MGSNKSHSPINMALKPYPELILESVPQLYYRLGELSGIIAVNAQVLFPGTNGTYQGLMGAPLPELGVTGALPFDTNTAVRFTTAPGGITNQVTIPNVALPSVPLQFSFEMWVRPTDSQAGITPILFLNLPLAISFGSVVSPVPPYPLLFGISSMAGNRSLAIPSVVSANVWTYLAFTYDGQFSTIYKNGEFLVNADFGSSSAPTAVVGNSLFPNANTDVDEFAFYTNTLTANDIRLHFAASCR